MHLAAYLAYIKNLPFLTSERTVLGTVIQAGEDSFIITTRSMIWKNHFHKIFRGKFGANGNFCRLVDFCVHVPGRLLEHFLVMPAVLIFCDRLILHVA